MTIFRFDSSKIDWKVRLATLAAYVGMIGFTGCWIVSWTTETRVFADASYSQASEARTSAIFVKGAVYYVEPDYGTRYKIADRGIWLFFLSFWLGGAYLNRKKRNPAP